MSAKRILLVASLIVLAACDYNPTGTSSRPSTPAASAQTGQDSSQAQSQARPHQKLDP